MSVLRVVYKYELWPWQCTYTVGANPIIRHVDEQVGKVCMWVEHDVEGTTTVEIAVVGTGVTRNEFGRFIGTVLMRTEGLVLHVYELPRNPEPKETK